MQKANSTVQRHSKILPPNSTATFYVRIITQPSHMRKSTGQDRTCPREEIVQSYVSVKERRCQEEPKRQRKGDEEWKRRVGIGGFMRLRLGPLYQKNHTQTGQSNIPQPSKSFIGPVKPLTRMLAEICYTFQFLSARKAIWELVTYVSYIYFASSGSQLLACFVWLLSNRRYIEDITIPFYFPTQKNIQP